MLNRRILRIKAFKVLYSLAENPSMSLKDAQACLELSCEATRDLYLLMLSIVGPISAEASSRIEAAKHKFNPTEAERNASLKFASNGIARILDEDPDFQKLLKKKKLDWEQQDAFIRHIYDEIREQDYFQAYMESDNSSLEEDAALWVRIFEREFVDNEELEPILEDRSIWWNDDLAYALTYCCRTVTELASLARWDLPALYQSDMPGNESMESDKAFVFKLLDKGFCCFNDYYSKVAECTPKWDKNRLCVTDVCLIACGLAESAAFPRMPAKIIINEYVEISKYYSTPESRAFVNGVLDKLINNR